jgi:hypothetical protein
MSKCEVVTQWKPTLTHCGKPAVAYYPAMGGSRMLLCSEHVQKHAQTEKAAEAVGLRSVATDQPYGWSAPATYPAPALSADGSVSLHRVEP